MGDPVDLTAERERRAVGRARDRRVSLTIPDEQMPPRMPVTAPGLTVVVLDARGTEAFRMPCESGAGVAECAVGVWPGLGERAAVAAALREALSVMDQAAALAPAP